MKLNELLSKTQEILRRLSVDKGFMGTLTLSHYSVVCRLSTRDGRYKVENSIHWSLLDSSEIPFAHIEGAFQILEAKLDEIVRS